MRVDDFALDGIYVRVAYKSGLLDDGGDPAVFLGAPNWLTRVADLETRLLVNTNPLFQLKPEETAQARLESRISSILTRHARYAPMSEKPTNSSHTASTT